MRELTAREVLSFCPVVLLRLVRTASACRQLEFCFLVDIDYVDYLICLANQNHWAA